MSETKATLDDLARRAVACPKWRWMPGMAVKRKEADTRLKDFDTLVLGDMSFVVSEVRVTAPAFVICEPQHHFVDVSTLLNEKTRSVGSMFTKDLIPDFSDPATIGCLLALVREAHSDPKMFVEAHSPFDDAWICLGVVFSGKWVAHSEAEALVVALEAAT